MTGARAKKPMNAPHVLLRSMKLFLPVVVVYVALWGIFMLYPVRVIEVVLAVPMLIANLLGGAGVPGLIPPGNWKALAPPTVLGWVVVFFPVWLFCCAIAWGSSPRRRRD